MTYNNCATEGFCSVDPIVYSLMEVFLYELKQITYYYIKMQELGYENVQLKSRIIDYLSLVLIGYEFNRTEFENLLFKLHSQKESVKKAYVSRCDEENIDCQILKSNIRFEKFNLSKIIKQGEKQALLRNKKLSLGVKNLYEIILNLIRSASIKLVELKYYTNDYIPEEDSILKLFNSLNFVANNEAKLFKKINAFAKINYEIHKKIHLLKEEYYGEILLNEVSVGEFKGKGILVSGQNLKDLENLLEATKNTDINVYTHNGLVVAHAYPKFKNYANLKGHFQISLDNVQYDFSVFEGPTLIIRNFQYLIDRLYRGRVFTTYLIAGKGMSKIENQDFSPLLQVAKNSIGYSKDNIIANIKVGYDKNNVMSEVDKIIEKIKNKEIKHLIIVGLMNHSAIKSNYFDVLEENLPEDYFVLSTVIPSKKDNILYFDSFFNSSLIYKILAHLKMEIDFDTLSISVFATTCNLHTISHLMNLRYLGVKNIYLPECTTNAISPNILNFLKTKFDIKQVSANPKQDLQNL